MQLVRLARLFEHAVYELHCIVVGHVRMYIGPALLSVRLSHN
jgi:hypothetical protein